MSYFNQYHCNKNI